MAEPWSVRRARYAGEALRPPRKTTSEDHDDDAFPASRDERSAERSRRAASAAPAPRLGPILALVTRPDRVQHVYCKRTNETVPCVAIRLADDTFDGLRVVLWRAHAAADVGAEHTRAAIVGTPHPSKRRSTEKNAFPDPSPLTDSFLPLSRRLEHAKNRRRRRRAGGCGPARALERVPRRARARLGVRREPRRACHRERAAVCAFGLAAGSRRFAGRRREPTRGGARDPRAFGVAAFRAPNRLRVRRRTNRRPDDKHETRIARARGRGVGARAQGVVGQSRGARGCETDPRLVRELRAFRKRSGNAEASQFQQRFRQRMCDPLLRAKRKRKRKRGARRLAAEAFVRGGFGG